MANISSGDQVRYESAGLKDAVCYKNDICQTMYQLQEQKWNNDQNKTNSNIWKSGWKCFGLALQLALIFSHKIHGFLGSSFWGWQILVLEQTQNASMVTAIWIFEEIG